MILIRCQVQGKCKTYQERQPRKDPQETNDRGFSLDQYKSFLRGKSSFSFLSSWPWWVGDVRPRVASDTVYATACECLWWWTCTAGGSASCRQSSVQTVLWEGRRASAALWTCWIFSASRGDTSTSLPPSPWARYVLTIRNPVKCEPPGTSSYSFTHSH